MLRGWTSNRLYDTWTKPIIRATTSIHANFLSILQEKTYFFYFTHLLLQNTHISLSILHIYSIKYSFFLHFLLFPSLWNKLTNLSSPSSHTHTQPATLQQNSSSHTHTHPSTKSPTPNQPSSFLSSYKPNINPKSPTPSHQPPSTIK